MKNSKVSKSALIFASALTVAVVLSPIVLADSGESEMEVLLPTTEVSIGSDKGTETESGFTTSPVEEIVEDLTSEVKTSSDLLDPVEYPPKEVVLTTQQIPTSPESCPQWHQLALEVGWDVEELERLSYVMWRESRCDPTQTNWSDPTRYGSKGLTQINGFWCLPNRYTSSGYLQDVGELSHCEDLHDPKVSLSASLAIWNYALDRHGCGWGPWSTKKTRWCNNQ